MSTMSLNLVFVTFVALIMLTNGNPIESIEESDIIVCPEGAANACKTFVMIRRSNKFAQVATGQSFAITSVSRLKLCSKINARFIAPKFFSCFYSD